jgi:hypothetical protein
MCLCVCVCVCVGGGGGYATYTVCICSSNMDNVVEHTVVITPNVRVFTLVVPLSHNLLRRGRVERASQTIHFHNNKMCVCNKMTV